MGLLELVSIQNQYLVILEKSLFYFPQCTVTLVKSHCPFEGRLGERLTKFLAMQWDLSSMRLVIQRVLGLSTYSDIRID